jgi:cell wall-associated NlpC family hydrolase
MAETGKGLSGTAVAAMAVGTLLIYAGFRGVSPLKALRSVTSGTPEAIISKNAGLSGGTTTENFSSRLNVNGTAFGQRVIAAAQKYSNDKYSQLNRNQPGYSDCSSFAAKAFVDGGAIGVKKGWNTYVFLASKYFKKIPTKDAAAGDILINSGHMALVTSPGQAIGQQNSRSNVHVSTFASIMAGTGTYIAMRYVGPITGNNGQAGPYA